MNLWLGLPPFSVHCSTFPLSPYPITFLSKLNFLGVFFNLDYIIDSFISVFITATSASIISLAPRLDLSGLGRRRCTPLSSSRGWWNFNVWVTFNFAPQTRSYRTVPSIYFLYLHFLLGRGWGRINENRQDMFLLEMTLFQRSQVFK